VKVLNKLSAKEISDKNTANATQIFEKNARISGSPQENQKILYDIILDSSR
jgi:hypothetical protein